MADFSDPTPEDDEEDMQYHSQMDGGSTLGDAEKTNLFLYAWIALTVVIFVIIVF